MASRHVTATAITLLALVPVRVAAQGGLEDAVTSPTTPEELALAYGIYVAVTLVVGAIVLTVSQAFVRAVEKRIDERPLNAGAVGLGVLVGSFVALVVANAVASLLVESGVPAVVGLVPAILAFAISVGVTVINTIGIIVVGSVLLHRVGSGGEPNPWLALVVGALVVQLLYLIPIVNVVVGICVLALATGGVISHWWHDRRNGRADAEQRTRSADH